MWRKRSRPPQFAQEAAEDQEDEDSIGLREGREESFSPARPTGGLRQLLSQQNVALKRPEESEKIIKRVQRVRRDLEQIEGMEPADGQSTSATERAGHLITLKPDDSNHHHYQSPHKLIDKLLESSSSAHHLSNSSTQIEQLQLQLAPSTNSSESLQRVALLESLKTDLDHHLSSGQQQDQFNATFQRQPTDQSAGELDFFLPLFVLLVSINLIVILGNILVIVAVHANAKLRNVTNIFIVSLATADLLLGLFVLPYALVYEVLDVWVFGQIWCRGWLVTDVWISTASILNLCAISIDRYVAVTRPVKYRSIMTNRRAKCIVAIVWILAFIISLPPLLTELSPSSGQTGGGSSSQSPSYSIPARTIDNLPGLSQETTPPMTTTTIPRNIELSSVSRRRRQSSLAATTSVLIRPSSLESASWITELSAENNAPNDAASRLMGSSGVDIMKQVTNDSNNNNRNQATGHAGRQTIADESLFSWPNSHSETSFRSDPSTRLKRMVSAAKQVQVSSGESAHPVEMPKANEFSWQRSETSADSKRFRRSTSAASFKRREPLQSGDQRSRPPPRRLDDIDQVGLSFMGSVKGSGASGAAAARRPTPSKPRNIKTATTTEENGRQEIKLPFGLFIVLNEHSAERFQVADRDRIERDDDDDDAPHKSWRLSWLSALLNAPLECHRKQRACAVQGHGNCLLLLFFAPLEEHEREENRSNSTGGRPKAGARCWMRPLQAVVREVGQRHQQPPATRSLSDDDDYYFRGGRRPRGKNPSVINDNNGTETEANANGEAVANGRKRIRTNMAGVGDYDDDDDEQFCLRRILDQLVCESSSSRQPLEAQVHPRTNRRKQPPPMGSIFPDEAIDCLGHDERQVEPLVFQWRRRMAKLALKRCCCTLIGKVSHRRPQDRLVFHSTGDDKTREQLPSKSKSARVSSLLGTLAKRTLVGAKEEKAAVLEYGDNKVRLVELAHVSRDGQTATAMAHNELRDRRRGTRAGGIELATTKNAVGLQPAAAAAGVQLAAGRNEQEDSSSPLARGDFIANRKMDYSHEGTRRRDDGAERDWNERQRRQNSRGLKTSAASDSVLSRSGSWQALPLDHKDDLGRLIDELHFHCHSNGLARTCSRCISLLPPFELTETEALERPTAKRAPNGSSARANPKGSTSAPIGHVVLVLAAEWARPGMALIRVSNGRSLADRDVASEDQSNSLAADSVASELSRSMESLRSLAVGPNSKAPALQPKDSGEGDSQNRRRGRAQIDNGIRVKDETEKGRRVEGVAAAAAAASSELERDRSWPHSRRDVKTGAAYSLGAISSWAGRAPAQSANDPTGTKAPKPSPKTFAPRPLAPAKTNNEAAAAAAQLGKESAEQLWHNNDDNEDDDGDDINDYFAASRPTNPSKRTRTGLFDFGPVQSARLHNVNSSVKLEQVAGSGMGPAQRVAADDEMRRRQPESVGHIRLNRLRRDIDSDERSEDSLGASVDGEQAPIGPRRKWGCALFHQKTYVVYSALGSFFIPMLVMVFFYSRIYLVASRAQKAMQRGYMTTKWPPLATNNNKQNSAQNNKRQSNSQTGSSNSTRSAWTRASFKRSSLSQVRSNDGELTRSSRANSRENSACGASSELRRVSSRDQDLASGLEPRGGGATLMSQPERVTLRIHRRTEPPPQQQTTQSQISQKPSFKALALKSAALIKSYNQQQQQQSSVTASKVLRAISNESQNTVTTVENDGDKSTLMQMVAVEQKLSLNKANNCQRRTRFSLDEGPGDRPEVRTNKNNANRISSSQPQSATRKRSSLPPAIKITELPAIDQDATGEGIEVKNKPNDDEQISEGDEISNKTTSNGSANGDQNQSMVISIDASDDRCRHRDHAHKKPRRLAQNEADHHHHHHRNHHRHPHRHHHHHHHRYKHHNDCSSANRAIANLGCNQTGSDQKLKLAANSIQITIENNVDELEHGTGSRVQLESDSCSKEDSDFPVPTRRTDRSQSQAVTPTIVVNWDPESGQAASQFAQVSGQQLMQASMPILPLAPTSTATVVASNRKSQLEATAATMHQSLSGSGLSLVATIPHQVRKQSMMLLSSITSRSGQTLRRLSMVAAHPVDSFLLKSRANSSTSGGTSRRRNRRHNRRNGRSRSCSSSSARSCDLTGSCRSSSLSESSGTNLAAADDDEQNRKTDRMLNEGAQAHLSRGRNPRSGDRFNSSSSEHEIGVDQHGHLFDGGARRSGKFAQRANLASNKSRRARSTASGAASPKKTLDDYLMAVAGIDNSSDEQDEEEEDGQSDNSLDSSPPSRPSLASSSSSSSGASNLTSMLRKENLLIPTIAIVSPDSNSENMIQPDETNCNEQEKKVEVSATRRSSLKDRHSASEHHHHQMEQQLDLLDKQVKRSEYLPLTSGLHRQGALYESATSRRQSQASSLSNSCGGGGGSSEICLREKSPTSPKKFVNESNTFSNSQNQSSRSPDLFRLLDPKVRRANALGMTRSELELRGEPKSNQVATATTTTTTNATGTRRRGLKRTSRWHAKRLRAETKAAKTVGIIVGGFIFCWLPFFTAYLSRAIICSNPSCIPQTWLSLSIWLGYINSAINPVIYGLFSADFRQAFKSIVCRCSLRSNQVQTPSHHHHQRAAANNYRNHYNVQSAATGHESAVLGTLADGILKSFL